MTDRLGLQLVLPAVLALLPTAVWGLTGRNTKPLTWVDAVATGFMVAAVTAVAWYVFRDVSSANMVPGYVLAAAALLAVGIRPVTHNSRTAYSVLSLSACLLLLGFGFLSLCVIWPWVRDFPNPILFVLALQPSFLGNRLIEGRIRGIPHRSAGAVGEAIGELYGLRRMPVVLEGWGTALNLDWDGRNWGIGARLAEVAGPSELRFLLERALIRGSGIVPRRELLGLTVAGGALIGVCSVVPKDFNFVATICGAIVLGILRPLFVELGRRKQVRQLIESTDPRMAMTAIRMLGPSPVRDRDMHEIERRLGVTTPESPSKDASSTT